MITYVAEIAGHKATVKPDGVLRHLWAWQVAYSDGSVALRHSFTYNSRLPLRAAKEQAAAALRYQAHRGLIADKTARFKKVVVP